MVKNMVEIQLNEIRKQLGTLIRCPCGNDNVHCNDMRGNGIDPRDLPHPCMQDDGGWVMRCTCENDCEFDLVLSFHEGQTVLGYANWLQKKDYAEDDGYNGFYDLFAPVLTKDDSHDGNV